MSGPLEPPYSSPSFKRNYSMMLTQARHSWNSLFSPHLLAPHTPWEAALPTEAKYHGSGLGFRPINGGEGGRVTSSARRLAVTAPRNSSRWWC